MVILETYMQEKCNDDEFVDSHITVFCISRKNLKEMVKVLGFDIAGVKNVREFMKKYTYDLSERVYRCGKQSGMIVDEWIEESAI